MGNFFPCCLTSNFHMTTGSGDTAHGGLSNSKTKEMGFTYFKCKYEEPKPWNPFIKVGVQDLFIHLFIWGYYQLSHLRPCPGSNRSLRGGRQECYHSATVAVGVQESEFYNRLCYFYVIKGQSWGFTSHSTASFF